METTVRALVRARARHFVLGVVLSAATMGALWLGATLDGRRTAAARPAVARAAVAGRPSDWRGPTAQVPPTSIVLRVLTWSALLCGIGAVYHLHEWRGKTQRYRNQRRRAANELLRADFRSVRCD